MEFKYFINRRKRNKGIKIKVISGKYMVRWVDLYFNKRWMKNFKDLNKYRYNMFIDQNYKYKRIMR